MNVLTTMTGDAARLRLVGELDCWSWGRLTVAAWECLERLPAGGELRVDLARCTSCDTTGMSALVAVWKSARKVGVTVRVENRPPLVDRVLDVAGVRELFDGVAPVGGSR